MKILFVCSANICRSALAEVILRKKLQERGITDFDVDSAGLFDYAGEPRDEMMIQYAAKTGYELGGFLKQISQSLADPVELFICMEYFQLMVLQRFHVPCERWNCIRRFNDICFGDQSDLLDPSSDTDYMYHYVFKKNQEGCERLVVKFALCMDNKAVFDNRYMTKKYKSRKIVILYIINKNNKLFRFFFVLLQQNTDLS